ncbi:glycosyltransferase family 4 protein [Myxococcaceae bacterium GXIMD 01537]
MSRASWHFLTGEYPPQPGGVSDYTRQVASALARAGESVHVWAPPASGDELNDPGVRVHRLPSPFHPSDLYNLGRQLDAIPGPRRLVVQYVPFAYGLRGMNVPFCLWLQARRAERVWVMFHEVAYPFERGQSLQRHILAGVQRTMASLLTQRADRLLVSIPAWENMLWPRRRAAGPAHWLPIPSNLPVHARPGAAETLRQRFAPQGALLGHFGTYGSLITPLLESALVPLLEADSSRTALLLGRGGPTFADELVRRTPSLAGRLHAPGPLEPQDVADHLAACTLLLQPYPDGISARRTSAMAGLALGVPMVTNAGALTEDVWRRTDAVALAPVPEGRSLAAAAETLLRDARARDVCARAAAGFYASEFSLERTLRTLSALAEEEESSHA